MDTGDALAAHWDDTYRLGDTTRSWFQHVPTFSMRMIDAAGISSRSSVIDIGGGAAMLVDALLAEGFVDVSVCDISAVGLHVAQQRLRGSAERVQWIVADVLTWCPKRTYDLWQDRAVFHFLTSDAARKRYRQTLHAATSPDAVAIFGCFAADGPQQCSGLLVARYDAAQLGVEMGDAWTLISEDREEHVTPELAVQPFTWAAFRRING